jgi:hypothetical protein
VQKNARSGLKPQLNTMVVINSFLILVKYLKESFFKRRSLLTGFYSHYMILEGKSALISWTIASLLNNFTRNPNLLVFQGKKSSLKICTPLAYRVSSLRENLNLFSPLHFLLCSQGQACTTSTSISVCEPEPSNGIS